MPPILLLIGSREDPHLTEFGELAAQSGYRPEILDLWSDTDSVVCSYGDGCGLDLYVEGKKIDAGDVAGVWLRQKPLVPHPTWGPMESAAASFKQGEWRTALLYLPEILSSAVWINDPERQLVINGKPGQLKLARECGLRVPETRITNRAAEVLQLFEDHEQVIYKPLNWASFPDQTSILTNVIEKKDVADNGSSIAQCPGIFQEFVPKEFEYRVTIVGERVFTALIRAEGYPGAEVDWRRAHLENIFEEGELAPKTEAGLLEFQRRAGLAFGAYDLIHGQDGRDYFLECNPSGQFLWLKYKCGMDITPAVLEFFEERLRSG